MVAGVDHAAEDNLPTLIAVGLLAYASADIAHHALGHGGACLALGGSIISLSSIFVQCTVRGVINDLGGPAANLLVGLGAALALRASKRWSATTRLFVILVAAFNLLWFALQLVFSAATRTDDWAWTIESFHLSDPIRYGMIVVGVLAYFRTTRFIATQMGPFARPRARASRIVLIAWLTAGATALATASLDHGTVRGILFHALSQSLVLSVGLLLVPRRAAALSPSPDPASPVTSSIRWIVAAGLVLGGSILLLGPGVAIG